MTVQHASTKHSRTRRKTPVGIITSLLSPSGQPVGNLQKTLWESDLDLNDLVAAFTQDERYLPYIRNILVSLSVAPEVITWRQNVLADFMRDPALVTRMRELLPQFASLRHTTTGPTRRSLLFEVADRLAELDLYIGVVQDLYDGLNQSAVQSDALRSLRENLLNIINDEEFQALREELPTLRAPLQRLSSITVGINLDKELQPVSAVLLSINEHAFGESGSFIERLLGLTTAPGDETGIAPVRYTPSDPDQRPLSPLFKDLDRLLTQVAQPLSRALARYARLSSGLLSGLEFELAFYVYASEFIHRLQDQGIPFCLPAIAAPEERVSSIVDLANVNLALRQNVPPVTSIVDFGPQGRIAILTGPNSGGKTTYLQAVGLAHVLFQAGLLIPAREARISPVDNIFTHFPALETWLHGRLEEEAERLREIFERSTPLSLVLLNESLASTTPGEALFLAKDVTSGLRAIGVRGIYATHLVELVDHIDEIEATVPGDSGLVSLVAGVQFTSEGHPAPTFRIMPGTPNGSGYAQEIARRHGISLDQILEMRRIQEQQKK